ncbi:hypothetical protein [Streptomyces xantholiticus]|uniref:hypothetical protein n=1 Tax=Streptomyces xantholiticus TaxID=68285 RepID=UPI001671D330|nr:hypothetical protein [Streptomyces xantholiticus]GGW74487.1 hypothetical protein GCM10010381_69080 [Streptomyces xantholiticus]
MLSSFGTRPRHDRTGRSAAVTASPTTAAHHETPGACPPERAAQLEADVRTALGTPPPLALLEEVLPADAEQSDGRAEPLVGWLRVWDWSPVLPARLLAGWEPVLDAVRRLKPAGPPDPRTAPVLEPVKATTVLDAEDLAEVAAARGPAAATAEDVGADGYAMVLHRLVAVAPAAWTANVPDVTPAPCWTPQRPCRRMNAPPRYRS